MFTQIDIALVIKVLVSSMLVTDVFSFQHVCTEVHNEPIPLFSLPSPKNIIAVGVSCPQSTYNIASCELNLCPSCWEINQQLCAIIGFWTDDEARWYDVLVNVAVSVLVIPTPQDVQRWQGGVWQSSVHGYVAKNFLDLFIANWWTKGLFDAPCHYFDSFSLQGGERAQFCAHPDSARHRNRLGPLLLLLLWLLMLL